MVYSASNVVGKEKYNDSFYFFKKQLFFYIIGLIASYFIITTDIKKIQKMTNIYTIISLALLTLVLIPGIGSSRGGARSWIDLGFISIQPSEFMKLGLILIYSKYLKDNYLDVRKFNYFFYLLLISGIIFFLIMLQPDFGTGLVIIFTAVIILFIAGAKISYFLIFVCVGLVLFIVLIISAPYRLQRITAFLDPWSDPLGSGFQGIQSLFAITPGGLFGHGFNSSMQKHFFLPEPQNDFIFAIFIEEFGLIGGMILVFLYVMYTIRTIKITKSLNDNYMRFLNIGILVSFITQIIINIYVVIGLLPVTGITLPLMSYGGSSLLITMVSLSISLNISKYKGYEI